MRAICKGETHAMALPGWQNSFRFDLYCGGTAPLYTRGNPACRGPWSPARQVHGTDLGIDGDRRWFEPGRRLQSEIWSVAARGVSIASDVFDARVLAAARRRTDSHPAGNVRKE